MSAERLLRERARDALASVGFVPTASKLYRPSPGIVSRAGLLSRVRAAGADVIAVTAAAGYGKSTFIAELVAADPRPSAWISLTGAENDPASFLSYVALALDEVDPVDPDCLMALWERPATVGSPAVLRFGAMLASRPRPFVLVLDDVHELVSQDALDALLVLVTELPPGSVLVIGSRRRIPLPWGRLRVRRGLLEVGPGDLAFHDGEAALLFEELGVQVAAGERARLLERIEGWPVAVYLAALAQGNGREPVSELVGDHRYLVEYLGDELLDELDGDVASFLMEASCFERMSGALCDEVLERRGSAALLEALQRDNRLVIPLDDHRHWYRFHHLLSEYLQAELDRRDPTRRIAIHLRASDWYDGHGDAHGAVTHAVLAGDLDRAEAVVMRWLNRTATAVGRSHIDRWVALFTEDQLVARPQMMVVAAWASYFTGSPRAATHWLSRLAAAVPEPHPDHPVSLAPVLLAMARAVIAPLGPDEMAREATYVYEHMDVGSWHPTPCLALGAAAFMRGDEIDAVRRLEEGAATTLDRPLPVANCLAHLAIIAAEHGRWAEARSAGRRAGAQLGDAAQSPASALILAVNVLVESQAGRAHDVADDHRLCRHHLTGLVGIAPWLNLQARLALARAALIRGDAVEARAMLEEAEAILAATPGAVHVAEQASALRRDLNVGGPASTSGRWTLTTAELRVLELLPTHLTIPEIGRRLYVSRNTVKTHTAAIYRKLGASSRHNAVGIAVEVGLLTA